MRDIGIIKMILFSFFHVKGIFYRKYINQFKGTLRLLYIPFHSIYFLLSAGKFGFVVAYNFLQMLPALDTLHTLFRQISVLFNSFSQKENVLLCESFNCEQ